MTALLDSTVLDGMLMAMGGGGQVEGKLLGGEEFKNWEVSVLEV